MTDATNPDSWSIHEALAVAYAAFVQRFGEDLLWTSFTALTAERQATLQEHRRWEADINQYLGHPLSLQGAALVTWAANARLDPTQGRLLMHIGVRWWLARDDLLQKPPASRVPCVYQEGLLDHVSLQLLSQMLYRGAAPGTAVPGHPPTRARRQ